MILSLLLFCAPCCLLKIRTFPLSFRRAAFMRTPTRSIKIYKCVIFNPRRHKINSQIRTLFNVSPLLYKPYIIKSIAAALNEKKGSSFDEPVDLYHPERTAVDS